MNRLEKICHSYSIYRNTINLNNTKGEVFLDINQCAKGEWTNFTAVDINIIMAEPAIYDVYLEFSFRRNNYSSGEILLLPNYHWYSNEFTIRSIQRNKNEFNSHASDNRASFIIGQQCDKIVNLNVFNIKNNKNIIRLGGGRFSDHYLDLYSTTQINNNEEWIKFGTIYHQPGPPGIIEWMRFFIKRIQ